MNFQKYFEISYRMYNDNWPTGQLAGGIAMENFWKINRNDFIVE